MTAVTVITNSVPRFTVEAWELPADARAEFDYLNWDALEAGEDSATFVRYKGEWIDLGDLERWTNPPAAYATFGQWDGFRSDTFFSGILVRFCSDHESVILGRYYS